jgi:fumarylacetoacetate (FAA) hydrolase
MKLGTLKDGTRDGRLVVISRNLVRAVHAPVTTLQQALDDWASTSVQLEALYAALNAGEAEGDFTFEEHAMLAPLPRSWQWLDVAAGSDDGNILMYQGAGDHFLGSRADIAVPGVSDDIDFGASLAVIVDQVPAGTSVDKAEQHIQLILLANVVTLRALAEEEARNGAAPLRSRPATGFAPVAVTPDEFGPEVWHEKRVQGTLQIYLNGRGYGRPECGRMLHSFPQLIAHAARTRGLGSGAVIGSGVIPNAGGDAVGCASIADRRASETASHGHARSDYLRLGDRIRIEMPDAEGVSIFGAIEQRVVQARGLAVSPVEDSVFGNGPELQQDDTVGVHDIQHEG